MGRTPDIDARTQSPNCGERKDGLTPSLIILHYTAMHSAEAACARLCDPKAEVSAHYLISRTGHIQNLVPEFMRAWHAGAGEWQGQEDINSRSIGIEMDNDGASPFSQPLMAALEALLPDIMARWSIPPSGIIGHSDMAPGRKCDPGPKFDWSRLERQGLAARPVSQTESGNLKSHARSAGYTAACDEKALLQTIRLRLRPWATGPETQADLDALKSREPPFHLAK